MDLVIVPNYVRDCINDKLGAAFKELPEAEKDKEILFKQLLQYFNEHGDLPDFKLVKKGESDAI